MPRQLAAAVFGQVVVSEILRSHGSQSRGIRGVHMRAAAKTTPLSGTSPAELAATLWAAGSQKCGS